MTISVILTRHGNGWMYDNSENEKGEHVPENEALEAMRSALGIVNSQAPLAPGDTVQLKSGGPLMSVERVHDEVGVECAPMAASAEPDAWQEELAHRVATPDGYEAAGPWVAILSCWNPPRWRRPLRKVAQ